MHRKRRLSDPVNENEPPENTVSAMDDEGSTTAPTDDEAPLLRKSAVFPHLPGVYLFRDEKGSVIYVGKARDLRKRIANYFRSAGQETMKTRALMTRAEDLEYMVTSTEKEALLLESSLIKKHRPRYNVILRDDKNYPSLRIDPRDPWPRLEVVRRLGKDGALYFGPYPSGYAVRETLKLLNRLFPLRQCKSKHLVTRERPCLNHSLGRCLGACAGLVSPDEYRKMVEEIVLFLQGKTDVLQRQLQERMEEASENLDYERAAFYRDRLRGIASMLEEQHVVSDRFLNQDAIGVYRSDDEAEISVLFIRQGVIIGHKSFGFADTCQETDELLAAFLQQYYAEGRYIPDEILIPTAIEDAAILEEWLGENRTRRVRIRSVKRGDPRRLVELAEKNAEERFASRKKLQAKNEGVLRGMQRVLRLPRTPERMACVDISNLQGRHAVGSVVVFENGQPDKSSYRLYRVLEKSEPDDPAMMAEIMGRLFEIDAELAAGLDLLVLDGGKGQLNRIHALMTENGMIDRLPLISIAKEKEGDRGEKGRGLYEKIYLPGRKNPLFLTHFPDILHLLQRLRDEAHRFAITGYKSIHSKDLLTSALDAIPGIGPARRVQLLRHFGSIEMLREACVEEVAVVPGISRDLAEIVVRTLREG